MPWHSREDSGYPKQRGRRGLRAVRVVGGFPDRLSATNIMIIKVRDKQARCDFEDIPPGTYALAVVHDENMNGKLDVNWLGVPSEGYGFSNDAHALLGAPSFSAASFPYDGRNLDLTIRLNY